MLHLTVPGCPNGTLLEERLHEPLVADPVGGCPASRPKIRQGMISRVINREVCHAEPVRR